MDNGSDLPQGSGWGDTSGRRDETQPQEEGVTERGVPGARGARHGQVGPCCVPAHAARCAGGSYSPSGAGQRAL